MSRRRVMLWCLAAAALTQLQCTPGKIVVLTFGHGAAMRQAEVVPVLQRYGFGATFFMCAPPSGSDALPSEHWEQAGAIVKKGFELASEGCRMVPPGAPMGSSLQNELHDADSFAEFVRAPRMVSFEYVNDAREPNGRAVLQGRGFQFALIGGNRAFDPKKDDAFGIPSFATWSMDKESVVRVLRQAHGGKIVVLSMRGVSGAQGEILEYLKQNGYTVIAMRDLAKYVQPDPRP